MNVYEQKAVRYIGVICHPSFKRFSIDDMDEDERNEHADYWRSLAIREKDCFDKIMEQIRAQVDELEINVQRRLFRHAYIHYRSWNIAMERAYCFRYWQS